MKKELNEIECWKDIVGYEGKYQVSDLGNVRSLDYNHTGEVKLLKPSLHNKGYYRVEFHKNGKRNMFYVHALVFTVFKGPIPPGMTVDHVNEIKTDNRPVNLQLLTREENSRKTHKGRKLTAAHRANLSLAAKAMWERKKLGKNCPLI